MLGLLEKAGFILLYGILFSGSGLVIQNWLVRKGIVRPDKISIIVSSFIFAIIIVFWSDDLSWWGTYFFGILIITLGANRSDLWTTFYKGPWWWKNVDGE